jgi:hypothetical protein
MRKRCNSVSSSSPSSTICTQPTGILIPSINVPNRISLRLSRRKKNCKINFRSFWTRIHNLRLRTPSKRVSLFPFKRRSPVRREILNSMPSKSRSLTREMLS